MARASTVFWGISVVLSSVTVRCVDSRNRPFRSRTMFCYEAVAILHSSIKCNRFCGCMLQTLSLKSAEKNVLKNNKSQLYGNIEKISVEPHY
ncbi:unnamed protein product [Brugia timori]|uniref:Secreted protein n=1 Tax=Brugia timori TaxID=42155 RepID=A0A0R3R8D4_9BILA|nr:unnamed protein product [Brugia timori]